MQKFLLLSLILVNYSIARQQFYDEEVPCQGLNSYCYDDLDTPPSYVDNVPFELLRDEVTTLDEETTSEEKKGATVEPEEESFEAEQIQ